MRVALAVGLLVACGKKSDSALPAAHVFANESVLQNEALDTCMAQDVGTIWPENLNPVVIDGFAVPHAPPYEIRAIEVGMLRGEGAAIGRDCTLDAGLDMRLWVDLEQPNKAGATAGGFPDLPPALAEVTLTADFTETQGAAQYVFPEPVLVEQTGTLWVGMVSAGVDSGTGPVACLVGCHDDAATTYEWKPEDGWSEATALPHFRVTIGHD